MVETLHEYHKVMVAIDGSDQSEQAFEKAVHVAKVNHAALLLCHVVDIRSFSSETSIMDAGLFEELHQSMQVKLDAYADLAHKNGVDEVQTIVETGSPKELLAQEIPEKEQVDLILCGQSGLNAVERFLMGSVSSFIINHAPCDILVVRSEET